MFEGRYAAAAIAAGLTVACAKPATDTGSKASGATEAQKTYKWKLVTTWPKNFPGLGTAPERFAQAVTRMSNGRLEIKVYGAGEIVPALEVFDAVSRGTVEMGHGAAYYWKGKVPEAQWFATVPFGMNARQANGWLSYGGGLALWRELYKPFGVRPFPGGNTGTQMGGWFNKEINSLDDVKGLKMRIPGLGGEVFRRAGGTPVLLPGGEIFTSLQTGAIDATEWVGPYNDLAFGLHKAAKYYYYPGWHEPGLVLELLVNEKAFASLPKDLQEVVETAARASNQDMLDEYTRRNSEALTALVTEHGVQLRRFPDDVLSEYKRLAAEVLAAERDRSAMGKKIFESYMAFQKASRSYQSVAEDAYQLVR